MTFPDTIEYAIVITWANEEQSIDSTWMGRLSAWEECYRLKNEFYLKEGRPEVTVVKCKLVPEPEEVVV